VLAYFGLFRVSELVVSSIVGSIDCLKIEDVTVYDTYIVVKLLKHKTNQRNVPTILQIPEERDSMLCPVKSLRTFLEVRPKKDGPLFCHADLKFVTRYQFTALLLKCVAKSGLSHKFRSHSFRIGRATDLSAMGVAASDIKAMGRWSSDSYKLYIR
jgi:site-specific recombinase XerD